MGKARHKLGHKSLSHKSQVTSHEPQVTIRVYACVGLVGLVADLDALEVGNGGMTTSEYRVKFSLWSLMKVLYCTVCAVLYCTVLYCTVLYCTVLHCTVSVLYCLPRPKGPSSLLPSTLHLFLHCFIVKVQPHSTRYYVLLSKSTVQFPVMSLPNEYKCSWTQLYASTHGCAAHTRQ